jgi:protein involved in polysaccharide export with SLBB domain
MTHILRTIRTWAASLWKGATAAYLILAVAGVLPGAARAAEPYRLGAEDRILVRAVTWDEAQRRFALWDVVSGEYAVQSDGTVAVPLAGAVPAAGLTTAELGEAMMAALESGGGLVETPRIAIEMLAYRPFYILGDVGRPGAYPARPGLTAIQAAALAGGTAGLAAEGGAGSAAGVRTAGSLREVLNQYARGRARQARLEAEVAKADSIAFPPGLAHPDGPAATARIRTEEVAIFTSRKAALERELAALADLRELLAVEIEGLERKLGGQAEQLRLARENIANITQLAERGFARANQLSDAQRGLIDLEAKETDLQNSIYRARQRVAENERDIIELQARRETQATVELQDVRARLEDLATRQDVLEQVLVAEGLGAELSRVAEVETTFTVLRSGRGRGEEIGPGDAIDPGDVLTVSLGILGGPEGVAPDAVQDPAEPTPDLQFGQ